MATVLGPTFFQSPSSRRLYSMSSSISIPKPLYFSLRRINRTSNSSSCSRKPCKYLCCLRLSKTPPHFVKFVPSASSEETNITESEEVQQPQNPSDVACDLEDGAGDGDDDEASNDGIVTGEESHSSLILASLQAYVDALANNDESKVTEIQSFMISIEDEKIALERKLASLSRELSEEKAQILRISAGFNNFRKRSERERVSLVANAQAEVVESLLSVLNEFDRTKAQIKVETEGEEKINNSYQSIYKQFTEILSTLGGFPVETVGNLFDPLASYQAGSKLNRLIDQLFRNLNNASSRFMKTWMRL